MSALIFELNESQKRDRQQVINFIEQYLVNRDREIEYEGNINHQDLEQLKVHGIWDVILGNEKDWVTKVTMLIELTKTSPSLAAMFVDLLVSKSILKDQMSEGFSTTAFVEEKAGSDLSLIETEAYKSADGWVLKGEKWFVFNCHLANQVMVLAKITEQTFGIFQIPLKAEGVQIQEQKKMGLEGLKFSKVRLNQVLIPDSAYILSVDETFESIKEANTLSSLSVAALSIGIAEFALNESLNRARSRQQFGQQIGDFQAIQFKIADITVGINASKTLIYQAAQKLDRKENSVIDASMAKVYSSEVAGRAVNHSVQIHGTHGVLNDSIVSKLYQSQRLTEILGQTSEMQRIAIGKHVIKTIGVKKEEVNHGFSL